MKNKFLPFQIGEEYENWEFDLEPMSNEKIPGYDSYLYLWIKPFMHIIANRMELIFQLDILQAVKLDIEPITSIEIDELVNLMLMCFGPYNENVQEESTALIYTLNNSIALWLIYYPLDNRAMIAYGKDDLMLQLFSGLET